MNQTTLRTTPAPHPVTTAHLPTAGNARRRVAVIVDHVLRVGKDDLCPDVAATARTVRARHRDDPAVVAVLDSVLDKQENHYSYRSYLALDVLGHLLPSAGRAEVADRLLPLLLDDVVRFELAASESPRTPLHRPAAESARKRVAKARRLIDVLAARNGTPAPPSEEELFRLRCSVLPVSRLHDEYFFLRVLQAYETTFTAMAVLLEQSLDAARSDDVDGVAHGVLRSATRLEDVSGLFSLLAMMPPEHFLMFRPRTSGSSAIQSASYKAFELICAVPPADRLHSLAYAELPVLRAHAETGPESLTSWFLRWSGGAAENERRTVLDAFTALEKAHQQWKRTHLSLTVRMLGDQAGTGGTDGAGYLESCLRNRLFWPLAGQFPAPGPRRTAFRVHTGGKD